MPPATARYRARPVYMQAQVYRCTHACTCTCAGLRKIARRMKPCSLLLDRDVCFFFFFVDKTATCTCADSTKHCRTTGCSDETCSLLLDRDVFFFFFFVDKTATCTCADSTKHCRTTGCSRVKLTEACVRVLQPRVFCDKADEARLTRFTEINFGKADCFR